FAPPFDLASTGILQQVQKDLVDHDKALKRHVRAELYKLNVYDEGAFFKPHKDTPRAQNMFGSLVIIFPTQHKGEALIESTPSDPEVALIRLLTSDVMHEVNP
ncbi:hypothetical protein MPER_12198, partial [Moniliophthora perniciosa FA553]